MHRLRRATLVLHLRRPTVRIQLALLYAGLFFASGVVLLILANVLVVRGTSATPAPSGSAFARAQQGTDIHQVAIDSAIALSVTVVLSLELGWLIAGRFLRPLRTITTTARAISASNLQQRLALGGPDDEFKALGNTLDDLFGRLEASFASQRHFVANASHELRTPLTAERTLLQVALADPEATAATLRSTCEEVLQLGSQQARLIEALLTLASTEGGVEEWQPFDLAKVAETVVLARRDEGERRGLHVAVTLSEAPAVGDPSLVESLVANLVDNALRQNVADGWVAISTTATAGWATISVRNTGSVIPPDQLDRLFQPFQQLGHERIRHTGGHGLGLAIVQAIAGAHGATLAAHPRPEGGLEIEVSFSRRRG
jgi:signal transduction histidine kinase